MKAKQRTLIALLVVLAVLSVALALSAWAGKHSEEAEQAAGRIELSTLTEDALERMEYDYDGETVALVRQDGQWVLEHDPAYHISQTRVQAMADIVCGLTAKRALDTTDHPADYGLETPAQTVTATADGQRWTVCFGDENTLTGDVYLCVEGDDAVYTADADVCAPFGYTAQELFEAFSPLGLSVSEITAIEYTRTGDGTAETVSLRKVSRLVESEAPGAESDDAEDAQAEYETVWLLADDRQADPSLVTAMLSQITANVSGQITAPADPAAYGLDAPQVTASLTNSDGEVSTVRLGLGQDGCYLALEGDASVYSTDMETLNAFAQTTEDLAAQSGRE